MDRFVVRRDDLIVDETEGGLVVYDKRTAQAHYLDASAAVVWRACEEPCTEAEVMRAVGIDAATCELVLSHLAERGLLETESGSVYSRRTVIRGAAKVGFAGALAAPIVSAIVPVAAAHASAGTGGNTGGGGGGTQHSFTVQSGNGGDPGTTDTNNDAIYNGAQASPPFPVGPPAFNTLPNGAYHAPIGTSNWISTDPYSGNNDDPFGYYYYTYTGSLVIPTGATGAMISGSFMSDNVGQVFVNNVQVADDSANQFSNPTDFSANLNPGNNTLQFQVNNEGGPTALDYFATVSYTL